MESAKTDKIRQRTGATVRRRVELCLRFKTHGSVDLIRFAEEFACSRRTVYRDLAFLREDIGMEIRHEAAAGGHIADQPSRTLKDLNQEQLVAIGLALMTNPLSLLVMQPRSHQSVCELTRETLEPEFLTKLDRLLEVFKHLQIDPSFPNSREEKLLKPLLDASLQARAVEVTHRVGDRMVPTALLVREVYRDENGSWVVAGHSLLAEACVELPLSRIESVQWQREDSELTAEAQRIDAASTGSHHLEIATSVTSKSGESSEC